MVLNVGVIMKMKKLELPMITEYDRIIIRINKNKRRKNIFLNIKFLLYKLIY